MVASHIVSPGKPSLRGDRRSPALVYCRFVWRQPSTEPEELESELQPENPPRKTKHFLAQKQNMLIKTQKISSLFFLLAICS